MRSTPAGRFGSFLETLRGAGAGFSSRHMPIASISASLSSSRFRPDAKHPGTLDFGPVGAVVFLADVCCEIHENPFPPSLSVRTTSNS